MEGGELKSGSGGHITRWDNQVKSFEWPGVVTALISSVICFLIRGDAHMHQRNASDNICMSHGHMMHSPELFS